MLSCLTAILAYAGWPLMRLRQKVICSPCRLHINDILAFLARLSFDRCLPAQFASQIHHGVGQEPQRTPHPTKTAPREHQSPLSHATPVRQPCCTTRGPCTESTCTIC